MRAKPLFLFLISTILIAGCGEQADDEPELLVLRGKALGTTWMVKVRSREPIDQEKLQTDLQSKIEEHEKILSHWRPDSVLYQLNASLATDPVTVPRVLHDLLRHAKWIHEQTNGAFDPTIAPLVNLWGFGPVSTDRLRIPAREEIEGTLGQVGMGRIEIIDRNRVRKTRPDLQIDLSASAKGEIIDQACSLLDRWGLKDYLVEIGGEVRAKGDGRNGPGWKVLLEDGSGARTTSVALRDYAVATSGTYRQSKPNPGSIKAASHLIDPRTGRPVEHDLVAVNILAPTARDADALATALLILGPRNGISMAEEMDLVARFCLKDANGSRNILSSAYERLFPE
tara:strand:+ start:2450 stop:3472 length:1023 start_codon:yes stop_codon:yes gene_type:complete